MTDFAYWPRKPPPRKQRATPPRPPGDSAKFKEWLEFMEATQKTAH